MSRQDTVKLLRECDAGVKMGIASIEEVVEHTRDGALRQRLAECRKAHQKLQREIAAQLRRCGEDGKEPSSMAKGMSWIKTNVKLSLSETDRTVAGLMTDGCDMGVKSLSRYLNEYQAADEDAKHTARVLIEVEEQLETDLRSYL